jgi:hypothetical protein
MMAKFGGVTSDEPLSMRAQAGSHLPHQYASNRSTSGMWRLRTTVGLDELRPYNNAATTTTVTGGRSGTYPSPGIRGTQSSHEELIGVKETIMVEYSEAYPDRDLER